MRRYRKLPVVIEAVRWTGDNMSEMPDGVIFHPAGPLEGYLSIKTLEGVMFAGPGNWIVRGVRGELYPVREDIFAATYEEVGET